MLINTHQVFGGCSSVMDKRRGQKWYCLKQKNDMALQYHMLNKGQIMQVVKWLFTDRWGTTGLYKQLQILQFHYLAKGEEFYKGNFWDLVQSRFQRLNPLIKP